MKKFFLAIGFLSIFFSSSNIALAADNCSWTKADSSNNNGLTTLSCPATKPRESTNDSNCSGSKPLFSLCCCDKEIAPATTATTEKTEALFTIPDFQVKIPGMMSHLPDVTCVTGQECSIPWIGQYIAGIYNYAMAIAGILAALVLMAGGLMWLISAGDVSKITQAKELIIGSISGLIILVASYVLLIQINPDLVNLKSITVTPIAKVDLEPVSSEGNPTDSKECNDCVTLQVPVKNKNQANSALSQKLTSAYSTSNNAGLSWQVTEAYRWTSEHKSKCHYNGMCVDVALTSSRTCDNVEKLITTLRNSGLTVLNEYTGCGGVKTANTTGGHLHVQ